MIRTPKQLLPILAFAAMLAACVSASTIDVSPGLLVVAAQADPANNHDLMRQQGEQIAGVPFVGGNRVELLMDGPATFAALAEAIRSARTRVDMETYQFDDEAGGEFSDILLAARSRGVEVNLIHDAVGTLATQDALFDRLKQGGVRVLEFNPLQPNERVPVEVNKRDHRKLLCVDGRLCITGGVNISKVYRNSPAPRGTKLDEQAWRDTDVLIEGPVVAQFGRYFVETWRKQRGPAIADPPPTTAMPAGSVVAQAIEGSPDSGQLLIHRTLLAAMALSQRSIHLTTGYFVPTPDLAAALMASARRGVDVQIVVPGLSDSAAALAAGRASYGKLMEAGVKVHERQGRVLHAKTAVIDGVWSAVGSSNLDWRSTVWNNEISAIILGPEFGAQMEAMFAGDVAASHTIELAAWRRRGPGHRLLELKAKLVETLL